MLFTCGLKCNIRWTIGKAAVIFVATFFGALIVTGIKILTASPAFILKKSGYIMQIMYNFRDYTRYPFGIYPKIMKILIPHMSLTETPFLRSRKFRAPTRKQEWRWM